MSRSLTDIVVGDRLIIQPQKARHGSWPDSWEVEVTKVGRRWLTVQRVEQPHWNADRVDRHTGIAEHDHNDWANHLGRYAFRNAVEAVQFVERFEALQAIRDGISSSRQLDRWRQWDPDLLERLGLLVEEARKRRS